MNKVIGFYDSCFFNQKMINDNSGYLILDESGNINKISHSEIRKKFKKIEKEKCQKS